MKSLKWLLFPFSLIYHIGVSLRNWAYDAGYFSTFKPKVKTICVGNLSVGGTGKSPMIEYLVRTYLKDHHIAVLSRGYKRKTKGCIEVLPHMSAKEVGDEPLQFKRKFNAVKVFVEANRSEGIRTILKKYSKTNLILLDDAFQHRKVKADKNILLTTYQNPYFKDYILPVGWLRESRNAAKRADVIVVTKCPLGIDKSVKEKYVNAIQPLRNQKVLFSNIKYAEYVYTIDKAIKLENIDDFYLITGIANPKPLIKFLREKNKTFEHLQYADHHNFTNEELLKINALECPVLTTEKDFMRLKDNISIPLYYLPIEIVLDENIREYL